MSNSSTTALIGTNGVPSLILQAAQAAAQADGVLLAAHPQSSTATNTNNNASVLQQARIAVQQQQRKKSSGGGCGSKKGPPLRRGKWTPEEEAYAARLIQEFKAGLLPLTDGTTLRTFLSKLLNCDPMRISKKFVGSNCIGKQVFRRRTNDMNRLTPEQIAQSRAELSELERRFLERVAQTNRVKNSGVAAAKVDAASADVPLSCSNNNNNNNNGGPNNGTNNNLNNGNNSTFPTPNQINNAMVGLLASAQQRQQNSQQQQQQQLHEIISNPPWLQPPNGYRHGMGASMASGNSRAAAAGRALLAAGLHGHSNSAAVLAELQCQAALQHHPLLAAVSGSSSAALQQLARNASGALSGSNEAASASMNSLNFLTSALSRDQLSQLAQSQHRASSNNNLNSGRQNSFDALMSLDLQSLQSMDNLASLIQNGGGGNHLSLSNLPQAGIKNADFSQSLLHQQQQQQQQQHSLLGGGGGDDNNGWMQRLASSNRIQSLLRSLNSNMNLNQAANNLHHHHNNNSDMSFASPSNANFANLLSSMQAASQQQLQQYNNHNPYAAAASSSAVSLADLLRRQDSHTGLSALRVQDGLSHRNTSVDDFLSLMATGDIPHQDASLLNVPLANHATDHSHSQSSINAANLSNALESSGRFPSAAALAMAQARAAAAASQHVKRGIDDVAGEVTSQGNEKR